MIHVFPQTIPTRLIRSVQSHAVAVALLSAAKLLALVLAGIMLGEQDGYSAQAFEFLPNGSIILIDRSAEKSNAPDEISIHTKIGTETRFDNDHDGKSDFRRIETGPYVIEQSMPFKNTFTRMVISRKSQTELVKFRLVLDPQHKLYRVTKLEKEKNRVFYSSVDEGGLELPTVSSATKTDLPAQPESKIADSENRPGFELACGAQNLNGLNPEFARAILHSSLESDPKIRNLVADSCPSPIREKIVAAITENLIGNSAGNSINSCVNGLKLRGLTPIDINSQLIAAYRSNSDRRSMITCVASLPNGKRAAFDQSSASSPIIFSLANSADLKSKHEIYAILLHELLHQGGINEESTTENLVKCCAENNPGKNESCLNLKDRFTVYNDGIQQFLRAASLRDSSTTLATDLQKEFKSSEESYRSRGCYPTDRSDKCQNAQNEFNHGVIEQFQRRCLQVLAMGECAKLTDNFSSTLSSSRMKQCLNLELSENREGKCLVFGKISNSDLSDLIETDLFQRRPSNSDSPALPPQLKQRPASRQNLVAHTVNSDRPTLGATEATGGQPQNVPPLSTDPTVTVATMAVAENTPTDPNAMARQAEQSEGIVAGARRQADAVFSQLDPFPSAGATTLSGRSPSQPSGSRPLGVQDIPASNLNTANLSANQGVEASIPFSTQPAAGTAPASANAPPERGDVSYTGGGSAGAGSSTGGRARNLATTGAGQESADRGDVSYTGANDSSGGGGGGGGSANLGSSGGGPSLSGGGSARRQARGAKLSGKPGRNPAGVTQAESDIPEPSRAFTSTTDVMNYIKTSSKSIDVLLHQKWFLNRINSLGIKIVDGNNHYYGRFDAATTWNVRMLRKAERK